jgi:hypothetical protein
MLNRRRAAKVALIGFALTLFGLQSLLAPTQAGPAERISLGTGVFEDKFPKSAAIQKWMPTGIIEMLVMTIGGYFLAILVASRYPNARTYVLVSFVLLSLPGVLLKIIGLFGVEGEEDWKITRSGKIIYRVFGVVALATLLYIILSGVLTH